MKLPEFAKRRMGNAFRGMPRHARIAIAFAFVASPLYGQAGSVPLLSTSEIARRAGPAVVTILSLDARGDTIALGSGFIVRPNGTVVTNWHVLKGASQAVIMMSTGEEFRRVVFLDGDETLDVAVIQFSGFGIRTVPISSTLPEVGARVVAIGSPLGLARTVSEGIVSSVRMIGGRQLLQMSAPISPGSSGGPVFDVRGRAVAIASSYLSGAQQINFAVPVKYALGLIELRSRPRELAAVFSGEAGESATGGVSSGFGQFRRTASVRPSLEGSYETSEIQQVTPSGGGNTYTGRRVGRLFLGPEDLGIGWASWTTQTDTSHFLVYVTSHSAVSDGRIALGYGSGNYAGYKTDTGFYGDAEYTLTDGRKIRARLTARLNPTPLTENSGVYEVESRTDAVSGDVHGSPVDWRGHAVVVVANGKITVGLLMRNSGGGSAGIVGSSALRGNWFSVFASDGKQQQQLQGTRDGGRLYGNWSDWREGGVRFEGTLSGKRQ